MRVYTKRMASSDERPQLRRTVKRWGDSDSENESIRRRAWKTGAIEVCIGLLFWAGCVYMMIRLNWNFTTMVGGGALRTSGPAIPAWCAFAILGSLGLAAVVCGVIDMRRAQLKKQALPGRK